MNSNAHEDEAVRLIRERGASATAARVQILRVLLAASTTASDQTLMQAVATRPLDKITLYRVLDWLVAQGLADRPSTPPPTPSGFEVHHIDVTVRARCADYAHAGA